MDKISSDAVWWHLQEISSRVVAESGIPSDRHHIGKILLRSLKDAPDFVMQIDGATNEEDTFKTAMDRSIRCAFAFSNIGIKRRDTIIIMAPNHIDLTIPLYAAFYLGIAAAGVDMYLGVNELKDTLETIAPKAIFCENSNVQVVEEAAKLLNISPHIITFGEKKDHMSFTEFLKKYSDADSINDFRLFATKFPTPFEMSLLVSPIQWITATFQFVLSPILRFTRVQSSLPCRPDHVYSLMNKYKPEITTMSPTFLTTLIKSEERQKCDFDSIKYFLIAGSAVTTELVEEIKKVAPKAVAKSLYGMSETSGPLTNPAYSPVGSIGVPFNTVQTKLVDAITKEVIHEPNVPGELYVRGPTVTKGYYNNPEITTQAFEDGWFKTGDIVYRDEYFNFYFVDRLKMLLKYRNHQVSPVEIEGVIIKHPGVVDVAVSGIPDDECGDLPVAFVVPREGCGLSETEIEDLVKASLTDTKHLRGGVVFLKELPVTATSKVDRQGLKKMAANLKDNK